MARPVPMDLQDAIEEWLIFRVDIDGMKIGTLKKDRSGIKLFREFCIQGRSPELNVHTIAYEHIQAYKVYRSRQRKPNGKPLSQCTKNNDSRVLRLFFAWTRTDGPRCKGPSPAGHLKIRRVERGVNDLAVRVPPEQWGDLLDAAYNAQVRWAMALALYSFQREGEIQLQTYGDITPKIDNAGHGYPGIVINREKGVKRDAEIRRDHVHMTIELQEEYDRWMKYYLSELAFQGVFKIDPSWPIVPAYRKGHGYVASDGLRHREFNYTEPMGRGVSNYVQRALAVIGFKTEKEGMHMCRRSGAWGYYQDLHLRQAAGEVLPDTPIRIVMALLGHKDQATTEIYIGITASRVARDGMMKGRRMIEKRLKKPEEIPVPAQVVALPARRLSVVRNVG